MAVSAGQGTGVPFMSMKARQRAVAVLLPLSLTLIATLLALELGFRTFYQLIPLKACASDNILGTYYCQPHFVYDKPIRIGYRYKPNLHFEGLWDPADPYLTDVGAETAPSDRSDAFWYVFQTDAMGFPNSQRTWREQYDVVITGDSFTTRTAPRTWIEILSEQTGKSILTLGASSWSTLNEAEAVKLYGLDKSPRWVILMYFEGNDLINTSQYLERWDSGLNWREYDMQGVALPRRLVTWHLARYWLSPEKQDVASARYRYPVFVNTEAGTIGTVFKDVHLLSLCADYETLARSLEFAHISLALRELNALVKAQGGRFLLVYIASKEHVTWSRIWDPVDVNNILERTVTVTLSEGTQGVLRWNPPYLDYATFNANHNAQERLFDDFARENEIEFLNLTPVLWQKTIEQGEFYHYADPHWNQVGNQLVADLVGDYIMSSSK